MKKALSIISTASFLAVVAPAFATGQVNLEPPLNIPSNGITVGGVVTFIINALVALGIIAALAFLIYGGLKWILSGGDKAGVEAARNHIIAAIIGLVIIILAWVILNIVFQIIGIGSLTTAFNLPTINNPTL